MSAGDDEAPVEEIEVLSDDRPRGTWVPLVSREACELLDHLPIPGAEKSAVRNQAVTILSRTVDPTAEPGRRTGLVIGYVQSGKTLSFTTVAALARDNQYPMVIVIAGTSIPLTEQSRQRLRRDLRLDTRPDRKWRAFHNPRAENADHIRAVLDEWNDPAIPEAERRTVLITVMKHHGHLSHLVRVLQQIPLERVPVLVIDDEGDQAGLNNLINEGDESTTYARLRRLKSVLPHHTFLQYTATPQGPLLINLIDVLSPEFAVVLEPGTEYVGGREFFVHGEGLARVIPPDEIPTRARPLQDPPSSLMEALRIFFLGVASGLVREQGAGNRSMMIHPSQRTVGHRQYFRWVHAIRTTWQQALADAYSPDRDQLIEEFRAAYDDLEATEPELGAFEDLVARLRHAIRSTEVHLVNATRGRTPEIDWSGAYGHILVGGQALDRGFTVEGLTVSYMPRGVGARRADTIQQRARFFGYKRPYLGLCRAFLEPVLSEAFTRYVDHEEDIRNRLRELSEDGRSLAEFRRVFLLPTGLQATRDSIIDIDYVRLRLRGGWIHVRAPHEPTEELAARRRRIDEFLATLDFREDDGHPDRTEIQRHNIAQGVPLSRLFGELLVELRFANLTDSQNLLGVLVIVRRHLDINPDATCTVVQMSKGLRRERSLDERGEVVKLFQGAAPVRPRERQGEVYPGDRAIRSDTELTVQVHHLDLVDTDNRRQQDVRELAIAIPREMAGDVAIQDQGGGEDDTD